MIAVYRVEINGKLWNAFTDKGEAAKQVEALRQQGMDAVIVAKSRVGDSPPVLENIT